MPVARPLLVLAASVAVSFPTVVALPPHGWDCIACETNSMLAGNWAIRSPLFNTTDLWWAHTIVSAYTGVALNFDQFNVSATVEQARTMKKISKV